MDRSQHLRKQHDLTPRNLMEGTPSYSGWKGVALDNSNLCLSQVFWTDLAWAQEYAILFRRVRDLISMRVPPSVSKSHPYIIVNDDSTRSEFGQPMKMPNILKAFRRAVDRCGFDRIVYRSGIHGLRHHYEDTLEDMKLTPTQIMRAMHHRDPESQEHYGSGSAQLNSTLNAAMVAIAKQRDAK